jgi:tetratricopeptide (TPR) repeat protein
MDHGDRRNGEADLRESIRLATAAGDTWATLAAIGTLGSMLAIYSMSDALAVIEEERAFERSRGLPPTSSDISRLQAFVALGRWDEAIDGVGPIADQAGARGGDAFIHGFATALRASIEVERGLYGGDPATLADEARRFGRPFALMALFPVAARLANAQGRRDYAAGLLEELAESLTADQLFEMDAVRAAAEIGRPDLARRLRGLAVESVRSTGVLDGLVAEASGDHVEARGAYRTAIAWARTVGVVPEEAYTLAGLGRCLLALGDTEEGVVRLRESRAIWERLRATPRIAEIDALLATVGASPDPA